MHTHEIARFDGLADRMPLYATIFMFFTLASMGFPGTSGFVGEFLVIVGSLQVNFWLALLGATGMILGVIYMLYLYRRMIFGRLTKEDLRAILDLSPREVALFVPLVLITLWMGIYPSSFSSFFDASVAAMVQHHTAALKTTPSWPVSGATMNWAIALPEIVLALVAMAILIFGVLRREDTSSCLPCSALGGFCWPRCWCYGAQGVGYHGQFVTTRSPASSKVLCWRVQRSR